MNNIFAIDKIITLEKENGHCLSTIADNCNTKTYIAKQRRNIMSFAQLKKNRSKSLENLSQQLDKLASKGYSEPLKEKYWVPSKDSAGNGFAIIRFLPAPDGEDMPFVRIWDHGFRGPGGWYIENSLTTINQDDPVSAYNSKLWNSGSDADKEQARKQKRRLKYHSNILVIKDSANPENEGKTFLFAYGKKIFDKLNNMMNPQFEDESPVNPFDMWEGADFRLKIRQVEGYINYDKSEFDAPSALFGGDDDKLEAIYNQLHSLQELLDPKYFKTYAELEAKLHRVLGITGTVTPSGKTADDMIDEDLDISKLGGSDEGPSIKETTSDAADDSDDDLAFFRSLANG
jgi:hypothetical protein